eukprot:TRINITY_DN12116_c0_g1_i1.p1 TRINITY_DN12116_c0_g1~~TRINITY_DN12116_c0_g1_i1.p1  ORF type:complete len:872 (-),score=138.22 TRINITY_DN12116_c0_g1_i1:571-2853(-)
MKNAVSTISTGYFNYRTKHKKDAEAKHKSKAAESIQVQWRRKAAQMRFRKMQRLLQQKRDELDGATELQRLWRGYLDRKKFLAHKAQKEKEREERRAADERRKQMLEEEVARWKVVEAIQAQQEADRVEKEKADAATLIQKWWRGYTTRVSIEHKQHCALAIQTVWRGHSARKKVKKRKERKHKVKEKTVHDALQQALRQHAPQYAVAGNANSNNSTAPSSRAVSRGKPGAELDEKTSKKKKGKAKDSVVAAPAPENDAALHGAAPKKSKKKKSAEQQPHKTAEQILAELEDQTQQFIATGRPQDALELQWRALEIRREYYGPEHRQTEDNALAIAELCNSVAQELITNGHLGEANKLINTCDKFTTKPLPEADQNHRRLMIRANMYHNLTCIKRTQGNVRRALKFAEKALSVLLHLHLLDQLPTSYLNICALYSSLGLHSEALRHAYMALQVVKELIELTVADKDVKVMTSSQKSTAETHLPNNLANLPDLSSLVAYADLGANMGPEEANTVKHQRLTQFRTQLAITYFNIAVEQEYLLQTEAYAHSYQLAFLTAQQHLGPDHPLTIKFRKNLKKVQQDDLAVQYGEHDGRKDKYGYGSTSVVGVDTVFSQNRGLFGKRGGRGSSGGGRGARARQQASTPPPAWKSPPHSAPQTNPNISPISHSTPSSNPSPWSQQQQPLRAPPGGHMIALSGMDYLTTTNEAPPPRGLPQQQRPPIRPKQFLPVVPHDQMNERAQAALAHHPPAVAAPSSRYGQLQPL